MSKRIRCSTPPPSASNYKIIHEDAVAKGAYGTIFRAVEVSNPRNQVAIKQIKSLENEVGLGATSIREISILKELAGHRNVVNLVDVEVHREGNLICLVLEWMDCDLRAFIEQRTLNNPAKRRFIMRQLVCAVAHMHSKSIFHRDLKPANVLINTKTLQIKLADFGLGRRFIPQRTYTRDVVSLSYRSPEILLGLREYTLAVDIWSMGCIFAELGMEGQLTFGSCGMCEYDQVVKIFRMLGTPHSMDVACVFFNVQCFPRWPEPIKSLLPMPANSLELGLLQRCLQIDHTKRISASEVLKHAYFTSC